jgi:hypothetical protein
MVFGEGFSICLRAASLYAGKRVTMNKVETLISGLVGVFASLATLVVEALKEGYNHDGAVETALMKAGLACHWRDHHDDLPDYLTRGDAEGTWLTLVGQELVTAICSYDWSDPYDRRRPGRALKDGENIIKFGDPHYEYVGIATANRLPIDTAEVWHKFCWSVVAELDKARLEDEAVLKKAWGLQMNLALVAAGCSKAEVQAWWSLQWKREWTPAQWAALCNRLDNQTVAWALAAHSSRYLDSIGAFVSSSFPRSMDAIEGLARAKGITKGVKKPFWDKAEGEVTPTAVVKGERVWSF